MMDIKPCPFCGKSPKMLVRTTWASVRCGAYVEHQPDGSWITRNECPAALLDVMGETLDEALQKWNTRHE